MRREPAYDGLRGISVLLVMMFPFVLLPAGWIGVQFFFVLSGFLITRVLLEDGGRTPLGRVIRFLVRRALRIFPLYFGALLAFEASHALTGEPAGLPRDGLPLIPSSSALAGGALHRHVWLFTLVNLAGMLFVASIGEGGIARRALLDGPAPGPFEPAHLVRGGSVPKEPSGGAPNDSRYPSGG